MIVKRSEYLLENYIETLEYNFMILSVLALNIFLV